MAAWFTVVERTKENWEERKKNKTKKRSPKWPVNQIRLQELCEYINFVNVLYFAFPFSQFFSIFLFFAFTNSFSSPRLTICLLLYLYARITNNLLTSTFNIERRKEKDCIFRSVSNFVVQLNVFLALLVNPIASATHSYTYTHILTQTSNIIDNNITFVCLPWAY